MFIQFNLHLQFDFSLYSRVTTLKSTNPDLKVLLAVGGQKTRSVSFSNMAATSANRREFIDSSIRYLRDRNFDGLDLDWRYPGRIGTGARDFENLAVLLQVCHSFLIQELRAHMKIVKQRKTTAICFSIRSLSKTGNWLDVCLSFFFICIELLWL